MQIFSSYLDDYIKTKNITYKRAAEMCSMNRTQLKRYVEGKLLPKNETIVIKMAQGLNMSLEDTLQMRKKYMHSKMGKNRYTIYKIIGRVWDSMGMVKLHGNTTQITKAENMHIADMKSLCGKCEIYPWVDYICRNVEHIYVKINPECEDVLEMLKCAAVNNKKCIIEHLIAINSFLENNETNDDRIFENLLSCIILGKQYKIYHKYRRKCSKKKEVLIYNYIITERGMVIICNCMNKLTGLFISKPEILSYYKDRFEKEVSKSYLYGMTAKEKECADKWEEYAYIRNEKNGMVFETGSNHGRKSICISNTDNLEKSILIEEGNIVGIFEEFIQNFEYIQNDTSEIFFGGG